MENCFGIFPNQVVRSKLNNWKPKETETAKHERRRQKREDRSPASAEAPTDVGEDDTKRHDSNTPSSNGIGGAAVVSEADTVTDDPHSPYMIRDHVGRMRIIRAAEEMSCW